MGSLEHQTPFPEGDDWSVGAGGQHVAVQHREADLVLEPAAVGRPAVTATTMSRSGTM
jgi:hypothetical protein